MLNYQLQIRAIVFLILGSYNRIVTSLKNNLSFFEFILLGFQKTKIIAVSHF